MRQHLLPFPSPAHSPSLHQVRDLTRLSLLPTHVLEADAPSRLPGPNVYPNLDAHARSRRCPVRSYFIGVVLVRVWDPVWGGQVAETIWPGEYHIWVSSPAAPARRRRPPASFLLHRLTPATDWRKRSPHAPEKGQRSLGSPKRLVGRQLRHPTAEGGL